MTSEIFEGNMCLHCDIVNLFHSRESYAWFFKMKLTERRNYMALIRDEADGMTVEQFMEANKPENQSILMRSTKKSNINYNKGIEYLRRLTGHTMPEQHPLFTCMCASCTLDEGTVVRLILPNVKKENLPSYTLNQGTTDEWIVHGMQIVICSLHLKVRICENQTRLFLSDLLAERTPAERNAVVVLLNSKLLTMGLTATVTQNEKKDHKFSSLSGPDVEILLFGRQVKVPSKQTGWTTKPYGFDLYTKVPLTTRTADGNLVVAKPGYIELQEFLQQHQKIVDVKRDKKILMWSTLAKIVQITSETRKGITLSFQFIFSLLISRYLLISFQLI